MTRSPTATPTPRSRPQPLLARPSLTPTRVRPTRAPVPRREGPGGAKGGAGNRCSTGHCNQAIVVMGGHMLRMDTTSQLRMFYNEERRLTNDRRSRKVLA